jgi:serine/threonine protein kinase
MPSDPPVPDDSTSPEDSDFERFTSKETKTVRNHPSDDGSGTGYDVSPPRALPKGTLLRDEYRVEEVLGMGGFGITYRARDTRLDTEVAIKEYYPRQVAGRTRDSRNIRPHSLEARAFVNGLKRFRQEGRTVAKFDHPNVVDVQSYFEENGTGYLVMKYYEGQSLDEYIHAKGGTLSEERAVGIMLDVLTGLHAVHAEGILHRDVDPRNIYITKDGDVILIDFGAAREAIGDPNQTLTVVLKKSYAPLEQYSAKGKQGPWTDVYACAATLYECLTGEAPPAVTERVQNDKIVDVNLQEVRPEVSRQTSLAVQKGLTIDPEKRPASPQEFAALLRSNRKAERSRSTFPKTRSQRPADDAVTRQEKTFNSSAANPSGAVSTLGIDEITSEDTGLPALGLTVFGLGLAGTVGTALLLSDADAMRVLAFFGTWLLVCGGLVALFQQGEQLMSPEGRAAISAWLLQEHFAERAANWPKAFGKLFDAVFTENHRSWACFWRSALGSVLVVATGILGIYALGDWSPGRALAQNNYLGIEGPVNVSGTVFALMIGYVVAANVVMDYASLYQTRWILKQMEKSRHRTKYFAYLLVDILLSAAVLVGLLVVFFGPFTAVVAELISDQGFTSFSAWLESFWHIVTGEIERALGGQARPVSVIFASTFLTSVWIWLYMGASLLLRTLHPVLQGLEILKRVIDVENRPAAAMGLLLAIVMSIGFAISAPLVL